MASSLLPSSCEAIIVGAGPSGLACALGLAARNVPFVILDAREGGHTDSRAVLMQANSLEVGLARSVVKFADTRPPDA